MRVMSRFHVLSSWHNDVISAWTLRLFRERGFLEHLHETPPRPAFASGTSTRGSPLISLVISDIGGWLNEYGKVAYN